MPLFVIERNFAEQLEVDGEALEQIKLINADVGVSWLYSFLSADKKKTYCLYEAVSPEAILEAARRAGLPADAVIEVSQIDPGPLGNEARDSSGRMVAADLLVVVERNGWVEGVVGLFCVERLPRAQEDLQTKR